LERYPRAAFVTGNLAFITKSGKTAGTLMEMNGREHELGFDDLFLGKARVSSVTSMYRMEALRAMGQLDESYRAEDPQIFWRLTSSGWTWVQWSGPPVLYYRLCLQSVTHHYATLDARTYQLVNELTPSWIHNILGASKAGYFIVS
jgi:hypothetical protein